MECKLWSVKCRARSVDTVKSSQRTLFGSVAFPYLVSFFLLALLHYQTKQKLPKSEALRRGPFLSIGVRFFFQVPGVCWRMHCCSFFSCFFFGFSPRLGSHLQKDGFAFFPGWFCIFGVCFPVRYSLGGCVWTCNDSCDMALATGNRQPAPSIWRPTSTSMYVLPH